jgi:hypothetical protein
MAAPFLHFYFSKFDCAIAPVPVKANNEAINKQGPKLHAPLFRNLVLSIKTAIILSSQKLLFAQ